MTTERNATSWRGFRDHLGIAIVPAGGVLVGAINIYLVGSLLPSVVADIGGERLYAWSTTIFSVAQVAGTPAVSRMLSLRGTVGSYLIGFGVFAAGSVVCAVSPVMAMFLIGRGVQGLGAGLLTGLGFAAVYVALPPSLWVRGTALISAMFGVGTIVGPVMVGLFAQFGVWRAAFVVLAVVGVAAAGSAPWVLPKSDDRQAPAPVPVVSLALVVGFLGPALLQRSHVSLPMVLAWLPLLFLAGAGIGIALPHLSVAAMTSAPDPEEGQKAAAAIATILTMLTAFGAAVAGLLVNLGGSSPVNSAHYLLLGFTAIAALGIPTTLRVNHTTRIPDLRKDTTAV
ncbi:MFS transporter [Nocardia brevicatena]|uniref:MFS transporter n=1 Tax=Nocardia brevicatena TaxID=37327 RepID=UPI00030D63D0|nr:MFS transporter [Nocardia brevicatena]